MGEPNSTLTTHDLKERVEDLTAFEKMAGLGSGFNKAEKDEWLDTKGKIKVGLLRSKELDTRITIFTEVFDFSKRTNAKVEFLDASVCGYKARDASDNEIRNAKKISVKANASQKNDASGNAVNAVNPVNTDASANPVDAANTDAQEKSNAVDSSGNGISANDSSGNDTSDNATSQTKDTSPELFDTYGNSPRDVSDNLVGTSTEFENLYLAWLQDETSLEKDGTSEDDVKEKIKSVMKSLFRFIFGTKKIKDLSKMHDKFRYAYTALNPEDKLPCNPEVLEHFRRSIEYRHGLVMCELSASRQIGVPEYAVYMEAKKALKFGLYNLLQMLSSGESFCMEYGGESEKEDNSSRILQIFRKFVEKRKSKPEDVDEDVLKDDLRNPERFPIQPWTPIYNDLIALLKWTADEAEVKRLRAYVQMLAAFIVYKPQLDKTGKSASDFKRVVEGLDSRIDSASRALADLKTQLQNPDLTAEQREILQRLYDSIDAQAKRFASMKSVDIQQGGAVPNERLTGLMEAFQIKGTPATELKENINVPKVMLTALLLKATANTVDTADAETLEEKAEKVLDIGQRPVVLKLLEKLIDEILSSANTNPSANAYNFKSLKMIDGLIELEEAYNDTFTSEEKRILEGLVEEKGYIHANNQKYSNVLGTTFMLNGNPPAGEIVLNGLDEEVIVSEEERADLEGGISLGGLIFLYLVAIKEYEEDEDEDEDENANDNENANENENENANDNENANENENENENENANENDNENVENENTE